MNMNKKKYIKKMISLTLAILLLLTASSCNDGEEEVSVPKIAYIKDVNGYSVGSEEKIRKTEDFLSEYTFKLDYIETKTVNDAGDNAIKALNNDYNLVFATSYTTSKALADNVSATVSSTVLTVGYDFNNENVHSIVLKFEESAFFGGVIAVAESKTKKIAYLGGYQDDASLPIEFGFYTGANAVDSKVKITSRYVKSFNNPAAAKKIVEELIADGVDVVFTNCGASALGIIEADTENKLKVICSIDYQLDDPRVIAYLKSDIEPAANEILGRFLEDGDLLEQSYIYGYLDGVFTFDTVRVSEEGKAILSNYMTKFYDASGSLVIPKNESEFKNFNYRVINN